jgi:hypothetical protein
MLMMIISAVAALAAQENGPVSKFDGMKADFAATSAKDIFEVERCLIDLRDQRAPLVYRQPDRPSESTIIWTILDGQAASRITLSKASGGTKITGWRTPKGARGCA